MSSHKNGILERWWPAFAVMAVIFVASSIPGSTMPDMGDFDFSLKKTGHATGYGLLAAAYLRALTEGRLASIRQIFLAAFMTLAYAISDECHQIFTPGRNASPVDVMIDLAGAIIGLTLWIWTRKQAAARTPDS
jgi:VanZ family protein